MKEIILQQLEFESIGFTDADGKWCSAVFEEDYNAIAERIVESILNLGNLKDGIVLRIDSVGGTV